MTEEVAFLEHKFLPPTLRRRIALLGFCHKVALGPSFCHPTLVAALPCTEDDQGAKVFEYHEDSCTEFKERLFSKSLFGALKYYNSISSALRKLPSVESFQSELTNQLRKMVCDGNPRWSRAIDFSESWTEYAGNLD